jgi:hypothetical protein
MRRTLAREHNPFHGAQLLGQVLLIESGILLRRQPLHLLPYLRGHRVRGLAPPIPVHERGDTFAPEPREQSLHVSLREVQDRRRGWHRQDAARYFGEDHHPSLLFRIHRHVLHSVTFSLNAYRVTES